MVAHKQNQNKTYKEKKNKECSTVTITAQIKNTTLPNFHTIR